VAGASRDGGGRCGGTLRSGWSNAAEQGNQNLVGPARLGWLGRRFIPGGAQMRVGGGLCGGTRVCSFIFVFTAAAAPILEQAELVEGAGVVALGRIETALEEREVGVPGGHRMSQGGAKLGGGADFLLPEIDFRVVQAAEEPVVADEVDDDALLDGADRVIEIEIPVFEGSERLRLLAGDGGGLGVEAVSERVLRGTGLAFRRGGALGFGAVDTAGLLLFSSRHKTSRLEGSRHARELRPGIGGSG